MRVFALILLAIAGAGATVTAAPSTASLESGNRIVGGSVTTINVYPFSVAVLRGSGNSFWHDCGGTIINNRSVLSGAHCFFMSPSVSLYRMRVGSTWSNSGGVVHNTNRLIIHPSYNHNTAEMDFIILQSASTFTYNNNVSPGSIAGANYNLADNQQVWAIGWGSTAEGAPFSEQLRHVQVWTINQNICAQRYARMRTVTANMLCAGWLDVGGRDACQGDSGGPLIHNNVIVGVTSWGAGCADPYYPGVNARVSHASQWITSNA